MKKLIALICSFALVVSLCACGSDSQQGSAKPLSEVFEDIKAQVTLEDNIEFGDVSKLDRYYGIAAEEVSEFAGCVNSSGTNQEEIVLIKAADSASADRIQQVLEDKYKSKLSENRDYNPEQAAMIEKCKVERDGLYVSMIISPSAQAITEIYKKAIGE